MPSTRPRRSSLPAVADADIRRVHVVFKTHLDIGFTDFAERVVRRYLDVFIPRAMGLAETMREAGGGARFVWTTGSWLIHEYLEQKRGSARRRMERAIEAGDIVWHALPFTLHSELMEPSLFRFGLSLSRTLDERFGRRTIAGKMTDVPGHTRGIVPLLAEAGVRFLHIGVNPASTPPSVPPVFRWRDAASGSEVVVAYHRRYGETTVYPGLDHALALCFTGDNKGPQSRADIERIFTQRRERFANATVRASSLDSFARQLLKHRDTMPVIEQELGDTWIHGIGTDPTKVAQFRALARWRRGVLDQKRPPVDPNGAAFHRFSRRLLLVPEHTWGMDEKENLGDVEAYQPAKLRRARRRPRWKRFEKSWREQRHYIEEAVALLPKRAQAQARQVLRETEPERPDLRGYTRVDPATAVVTSRWRMAVDPTTGAITALEDRQAGRKLATPRRTLGPVGYQVFTEADYKRFIDRYLHRHPQWAVFDFTKPGMRDGNTRRRWYAPRGAEVYMRQDEHATRCLVRMRFAAEASQRFGCPRLVTLEVVLPHAGRAVEFDLQWFDKPACRVAEAVWWMMDPPVAAPGAWRMEKLASLVSPHEVAPAGNRKLHGVWAIRHEQGGRSLEVAFLDAALVAPGRPALLEFDNRRPPVGRGMHANLYNNVWGTNFPMWHEDDARFRFRLRYG